MIAPATVTRLHAAADSTTKGGASFVLATAGGPSAPFVIEAGTDRAVARAADDVCADIERITGTRPARQAALAAGECEAVVVAGVAGHSSLLDGLAAAGKIDLRGLAGAWESFVVTVVPNPWPGVKQALVVAGSDRRGAIYGLYEISNLIGVSPWAWWADVVPRKQTELAIAPGTHRFGPPSVKYRGIFINDEDWGLVPWAAKTFEPETGNLGPKTYAKIFELLLRLRGNLVWPGMHPTTRAFNFYPQNKEVADAYGIIMGSSHAEPMLRNNVDEWTAPKQDYNYVTNRDGVLHYWEQRVTENSRYENIYTLGMRGIHDSVMQGPRTDAERIQVLQQVFADQRGLLARHVRPEIEQVPQMFCAYKEVLELYHQGLEVPDDVTIVWPDDNFGYVRNFATAAERKRAGGFGVYYHLSYLGRPLSYLWLNTTPPALIWEEMSKAYAHGADRIWVANIGDLKPAEIPTEFFLQMAWDINRWRADNLSQFLTEWATRNFGAEHAGEIADILAGYYLINFQRKPEHLQWWILPQEPKPSPLTDAEVRERLAALAALRARADALRAILPAEQQAAFTELVHYPVIGSTLANERYFRGERGETAAAQAADAELHQATDSYNRLADGKWRGMMSLEPANKEWESMRISQWVAPAQARPAVPAPAPGSYISVDAGDFILSTAAQGREWTVIPGLGRTGRAIAVLPTDGAAGDMADPASVPRVEYELNLPQVGEFEVQVYLLPTHPIVGDLLRFGLGVNDDKPQLVALDPEDGGPAWAQGVLNSVRVVKARVKFARAGPQVLRVYGVDAGVALDRIVIDLGGLSPTYLGPAPAARNPFPR